MGNFFKLYFILQNSSESTFGNHPALPQAPKAETPQEADFQRWWQNQVMGSSHSPGRMPPCPYGMWRGPISGQCHSFKTPEAPLKTQEVPPTRPLSIHEVHTKYVGVLSWANRYLPGLGMCNVKLSFVS